MRVGRTGPYLVAGLSKGARAGPLGAKLESVVILLEILWRLDHRGHLRSEFARLLAGRAQIGWIRGEMVFGSARVKSISCDRSCGEPAHSCQSNRRCSTCSPTF